MDYSLSTSDFYFKISFRVQYYPIKSNQKCTEKLLKLRTNEYIYECNLVSMSPPNDDSKLGPTMA